VKCKTFFSRISWFKSEW